MKQDADEAGRLVRPYTMTGGRTGRDLPADRARSANRRDPDRLRRTVTSIGSRPLASSISREPVGAGRSLRLASMYPVGVVRVVVADLARRGAVQILDPPTGTPRISIRTSTRSCSGRSSMESRASDRPRPMPVKIVLPVVWRGQDHLCWARSPRSSHYRARPS